jgi:hypothetical protein
MKGRFTVVVLALCGLGACSSGNGTPARDSRQQDVLVADSAALALVEEYLKRDARGEFLRDSEWRAEVTNFEIPRYEAVTLIGGYQILAEETSGDTTRVTVQYDVEGVMHAGPEGPAQPVLSRRDSVELQTFVVVNTEEGLRLAGPRLNPHVSGTAPSGYNLAGGIERLRALVEEAARRESATAVGDTCQEAAVAADSAALALVEEFLRRDARGEFTRVSEWLDEHLIYGGYGGDMMSVVSGYEIVAAETRCDTTRVTVRYDVIGGCCNRNPPEYKPEFFLAEDTVHVGTFTVVITEEGPRLTGDVVHPHVSGRAVLEWNFDDEEFRRALEEALRRKGG